MKVTKTYSIEESIYSAFDSLTTEKNINKSSAIEEYIRKFLKDNDMDFIDKLYCLKTDPDRMVTVVSQDTTYYFLNDGSKMQKILFLHLFKECDIINPNEFFKKSTPILEGIAEKIKSIDESKVSYFDGQEGRSFKSKVSDLTNKGTLDKLLDQLADRSYPEDKFEIKREQKDILNEINNNYKSGYYINKTKLELCDVLIKLIGIDFSEGSKEYQLKKLLYTVLEGYKNSLL